MQISADVFAQSCQQTDKQRRLHIVLGGCNNGNGNNDEVHLLYTSQNKKSPRGCAAVGSRCASMKVSGRRCRSHSPRQDETLCLTASQHSLFISRHPCSATNIVLVKPRLHDTAVCHNRLNVCIHDTTGCETGLTTGLTTGCIV